MFWRWRGLESPYFSAIQSMGSFSIHKNLLTSHFGDGSEEMVFAMIDPQTGVESVTPYYF